jgi:hypothetical protein
MPRPTTKKINQSIDNEKDGSYRPENVRRKKQDKKNRNHKPYRPFILTHQPIQMLYHKNKIRLKTKYRVKKYLLIS